MTIRLLTSADAGDFQPFRLRALAEEPGAFLSSPEEESRLTLEQLADRIRPSDDAFVLGAFVDGELVGNAGLFRRPKAKSRHNAVLWGMYVAPDQRGTGLGRELVEEVLRRTRSIDGVTAVHLSVNANNLPAQRLYESLGFRTWGIEPDSFRVDGEPIVEVHMRLEL